MEFVVVPYSLSFLYTPIIHIVCIRKYFHPVSVSDVASHKLEGGKNSFGKSASDEWSKKMQLAEGPRAFTAGYNAMLLKYSNDRPRKNVIMKLFRSPERHHFSRELSFVNAVLTDITECLFAAVKHWVFGHAKHSPMLFLAMVRIVQGCYKLMQKAYLERLSTVEKRVLKWTKCTPVRYLPTSNTLLHCHPPPACRAPSSIVTLLQHAEHPPPLSPSSSMPSSLLHCHPPPACRVPSSIVTLLLHVHRILFSTFARELTGWATDHMYKKFEILQWNYDLEKLTMSDGSIKFSVTNKRHGDKFLVDRKSFRCHHAPDAPSCAGHESAGRKCWQQVYSGLLCIHVLLVVLDQITHYRKTTDKVKLCCKAAKACHIHWHRSRWEHVTEDDNYLHVPPPVTLSMEAALTPHSGTPRNVNHSSSAITCVYPPLAPRRHVNHSSSAITCAYPPSAPRRHVNHSSSAITCVYPPLAPRRHVHHSSSVHHVHHSSSTITCTYPPRAINLVYPPPRATPPRNVHRSSSAITCTYPPRAINLVYPHPRATPPRNVHHSSSTITCTYPPRAINLVYPHPRATPPVDVLSSRRSLFGITEIQHVPFVNPKVRCREKKAKQEPKKKKKKKSPRRLSNRKRRPNRGSQSTEEEEEEEEEVRRTTPKSKKSTRVDHRQIHDAAVARGAHPGLTPHIKKFTVLGLTSMNKHLGLTPRRSDGRKRPNKQDRFDIWLEHYKTNSEYRHQCFLCQDRVRVGTKVAKYFGDTLFVGEVTDKYRDDEGEYLWHVKYSDGDEEDLNDQEVSTASATFECKDAI